MAEPSAWARDGRTGGTGQAVADSAARDVHPVMRRGVVARGIEGEAEADAFVYDDGLLRHDCRKHLAERF
jgi:hypothetical protein